MEGHSHRSGEEGTVFLFGVPTWSGIESDLEVLGLEAARSTILGM